MLNQVRTFLRTPTFPDDEDKTRKARYANAIAIAFFGISVLYELSIRILAGYRDISVPDLLIFGLGLACVLTLLMIRRGRVYAAAMVLVVLIWSVTNSIASTGYGVQDASFLLNFTIILMAGLLLNWQASLALTILSALSGLGLAYAERAGIITHTPYPITSFAQDVSFVFTFNLVVIYLLINGLETALKRSRASLERLELTNVDLSHTQSTLEQRTTELTLVNEQLENRTRKLRAIAAITATAASIHDFEALVSSVASIISRELGYYHAAVFLLDEQRQYAILHSASSEGGAKLLARGFRLALVQESIISNVARTGRPHNQDQATSRGYHLYDDLPDTQSELALPLKSGNQTIGVLDLHSTEPYAFNEDDVSTLSILADQIGIDIQNALLYEQSQSALREANATFLQTSEREWKGYAETLHAKGYRYDGIKPEAVKEPMQSNPEGNAVSIPVQLRGQTIGKLRLKPSDSSKEWTEDELAIAAATAERAALALEGARLLEEARKRAAREAFLSDIAAKLSTSFQLDSILRDTVEELGQTLTGSTISFQLVNPSAPLGAEPSDGNEPPSNRMPLE